VKAKAKAEVKAKAEDEVKAKAEDGICMGGYLMHIDLG